jgi:hypothetical protein
MTRTDFITHLQNSKTDVMKQTDETYDVKVTTLMP